MVALLDANVGAKGLASLTRGDVVGGGVQRDLQEGECNAKAGLAVQLLRRVPVRVLCG